MAHIFYEFPSLKPGVPDVETLMDVIKSSERTRFVMGEEVVDFVKKALIVNTTIGSFKNCYFAFDNGTHFLEFDGKGKSKRFNEVPDWFVSPAEFSRTQWLINHNLLFGLELEKVNAVPATASAAGKIGNKNGKTTKPRVTDLGSFELFSQFFARMKTAVQADEFPTLQILTGMDNLAKAPHNLKQGIRTWFKAIAGDLPPNNKRVEAGNAVLFCAPLREQIQRIEARGLEHYYQGLSKAIAEAGDGFISDFTYTYEQ